MPSLLDDIDEPVKCLMIGESGGGKTGALASLAAMGQKLRIVDTDKGVRTLRSLLMDYRYPYRKWMEDHGVDLGDALSYVPIDTKMGLKTLVTKIGDKQTTEKILAPKSASAWTKVGALLDEWKDGTRNLGHIETWGTDCTLVLDSFSTMAKQAYYFSQSLNGRLGNRDEGFDYQRDIGAAQSQLSRLLELLYDSGIRCNVIIISHITRVDESKGVASRPMGDRKPAGDDDEYVPPPKGYPAAIGRALSPQMGKYFNDVYIVESAGSGGTVSRKISTVPSDGVLAKNSVYMEKSYPISTGLAEIFAAHRGEKLPEGFVSTLRAPAKSQAPANPVTKA